MDTDRKDRKRGDKPREKTSARAERSIPRAGPVGAARPAPGRAWPEGGPEPRHGEDPGGTAEAPRIWEDRAG